MGAESKLTTVSTDLAFAMQYRKSKEVLHEIVEIQNSPIHGKGLYAKVCARGPMIRQEWTYDCPSQTTIKRDQIIIEYVGELIRPILCDPRERFYDSKV